MPARQRKPNDITQQVVPLILLAAGLVTTNGSAPFLDAEASFLGTAANPLRTIFPQLFSLASTHGSSPVYEVILHFWLRWTGEYDYLRIPSILFFIAGLFLLSRARHHVTGTPGGAALVWLGVLWPLGFHLVRLASWYSFSFFLVAGLTLSYLKFLERQALGRWAALFLFYIALLGTNYFGWAILGCLAIDQVLRVGAKEVVANPKPVLGVWGLLVASFPLFAVALRSEFSSAMQLHQGGRAILLSAGLNLFSIFVSVSVTPWYWRLSVPAALAVLICLVMAVRWIPRSARRFLIYSAGLVVLMALIGVLSSSYLLMLAPWVLLPVSVAIEAAKPRWATLALGSALLIIGGVGWYGIYSRRYYADLRFIEPWQEIAGDAAAKIGAGATVIADHPSFRFYLTDFLHLPARNGPWRFEGLLPDSVSHPQVYSSAAWLASGHPPAGKVILVRGGSEAEENQPIDKAARELDQSCGSISSRLRVRDEGYKWKQRFFPQLHEPQWRIEIREYDCDSSNSKQIYHLPPH